jgi:RNA polymerase sporulation-specific sigma factor
MQAFSNRLELSLPPLPRPLRAAWPWLRARWRRLQQIGALARQTRGVVHYITGAPSLPPPLTPEQERVLLQRMADGDAAARDALITHNLRLVVYLAKKFELSGVPTEDMISIGTIGLIKAVNTFTPERNIKLATYASRCIGNEILMYLRKSSSRRQEASIDEPLNVDGDGNELLLSDVLGSEEDLVSQRLEQNDERMLLREAVARLAPRERQIMELRFGLRDGAEHTQKETADAIGISQSYISRLEKRIIRELRLKLEADG